MKIRSNPFYKSINYLWPVAKFHLLLTIIIRIIEGFIPLVNLIITTRLINEVSEYITISSNGITFIIILLVSQLIMMLVQPLLKIINDYNGYKTLIKINYSTECTLYGKIFNTSYKSFDSPEFHNHLSRLKTNNIGQRLLSPFENGVSAISGFITIISTFIFLYNINWIIAILGLLTAIPGFIIHSKHGKQNYNLIHKQTPLSRELNYVQHLLYNKEAIKEQRVFSLEQFLLEKWKKIFIKNSNEKLNLQKKFYRFQIGLKGFNIICYGIAFYILIKLIQFKDIKLGSFVAVPQGISNLQNSVGQVSINLSNIYSSRLYLNDFFNFIEDDSDNDIHINENNERFPRPITKGIHFNNVSFGYFNSNNDALSNVTFRIDPGQKVAIVGENGSGKSTLIKCLLGLYSPTKGTIEIDGLNIRNINLEDYRKEVTAIFQDYIKYDYTVRENIAFGNIMKLDDSQEIQQIAKQSGVHDFVNVFEEGYNTRLGKYLGDGESLSGGQWQKIALSRALIRDAQIVVLDEPTASFDPNSEYKFYKKFKDLTFNKTLIYISHRMSSVKIADKIIFMKEGRVVETGTHEELLKREGHYFKMYYRQLEMYS
ncbi:ABC transporter ATP-binding protein [Rossellomorea yichunensis]|uniref:ABC transporter ATP-binding protein n=1 Tax=Rossellomorea yichunensis TaxID=3077331 RepID=UPI0028E05D99|nr:ABC transporter ATP-binding protein [Rossellomorea sp. YC4-1]MDT9027798.1 ABC transporter ATP-binding protein [Rossellomorea sp. YC4-1]